MMLNREKSVWHTDKHALGNAAEFVHKEGLIFLAAYMLKDSIRCRYMESVVFKWQRDIWLNLDIANEGKGLLELSTSAQSTGRNIFFYARSSAPTRLHCHLQHQTLRHPKFDLTATDVCAS